MYHTLHATVVLSQRGSLHGAEHQDRRVQGSQLSLACLYCLFFFFLFFFFLKNIFWCDLELMS